MAETASPFDGGPYMEEDDWSDLLYAGIANGVVDRFAATVSDLQQNLTTYSSDDGRQIRVTPGMAVIHGKLYRNTSTVIRSVMSNTTGSTRYDRVVVRLNENGSVAGGVPARTAAVVVIAGSSSLPNLADGAGGVWDVPLAVITVANNFSSLATDTVRLDRDWAAPRGFELWRDYDATAHAIIGFAPGQQVDALRNRARYQLVGTRCRVSYRWKTALTAGSASEYAVKLPVPAKWDGICGPARVQNFMGDATIIANSVAGLSPPDEFGIVTLKKYDGSFLPSDGSDTVFRYDSFDIEYEVADSV